ncbi:hypothetical protein NLG97_g6569 [Lecanicillium saksenae]|uniref:Uncharacterized protein n=1 Tax=Lecanicillium saksenae TaxID=468837 RepID=A0ACC1QQE2_9HYPO|nr:hypothetical protein NLG97_g6569 [Lecanicillium saksenae]
MSPEAAFKRFVVESWSLLSVAILITGWRTYFRISSIGIRKLDWDDYLVPLALVFYAGETALAFSVGNVAKGLANGGMTDIERAALSPNNPEHQLRIIGSRIQIAGWTSYGFVLWLLKTSMLCYYIRLTSGLHKSYTSQTYFAFALLGSTFIALMATTFLSCRPFHKYWQIYPDPGNACQPAVATQIIWTNLALNAATDLYLMSIPVPILWKSGLKISQKIASTLLFTSGIFVVVCSLLRGVLITVQDPINGPQTAGAWGIRESFLATITTNLPVLFPHIKLLFKSHLRPILFCTSPKSNHSVTLVDTIGGSDGHGGYRRHPVRSANPLPTRLTLTESVVELMDRDVEIGVSKCISTASV